MYILLKCTLRLQTYINPARRPSAEMKAEVDAQRGIAQASSRGSYQYQHRKMKEKEEIGKKIVEASGGTIVSTFKGLVLSERRAVREMSVEGESERGQARIRTSKRKANEMVERENHEATEGEELEGVSERAAAEGEVQGMSDDEGYGSADSIYNTGIDRLQLLLESVEGQLATQKARWSVHHIQRVQRVVQLLKLVIGGAPVFQASLDVAKYYKCVHVPDRRVGGSHTVFLQP